MNEYYSSHGNNLRKEKIFSFSEKILLLLLFLSTLDVYGYGIHIAVCAFAFYVIQGGFLTFRAGMIPVTILSLSYLIFWNNSLSGPTNIVKWLAWPLVYVIGYGLIIPKGDKREDFYIAERRARTVLMVVATGFFTHFVLNWLINIGSSDLNRNTVDFWTGESRAATGQAILVCMMIGVFVAILFSTNGLRKKLLAVIGLCVTAIYNFQLGARSIFLMILVSAFLALLFMFRNQRGGSRKIKILVFLAILVAVLVIVYQNDAFGVKTSFEESNFFKRFFARSSNMDITEDSRMDRKLQYLSLMPRFLWGGGYIHSIVDGYAHDAYLDTYDEAGLFALVAIIAITISAVMRLWKVIKSKVVSFETRQLFFCVYILIFTQFVTEPIFAGAPQLLVAFILLHGTVSRLSDNIRQLN